MLTLVVNMTSNMMTFFVGTVAQKDKFTVKFALAILSRNVYSVLNVVLVFE